MANGTPTHLASAARALQRILNARDPDHVYTVDVGPPGPGRGDREKFKPARAVQGSISAAPGRSKKEDS